MNILELQDNLKDLPDSVLMREMQMPSGNAPQFLVLSELKRRKRMRDEYQRQQSANTPTVAEEVVTAAGMPQEGIMGAARAMAPNTNMAQNTGMDTAAPVPATRAPQQPQMMADGGVVKMQTGGIPMYSPAAAENLRARPGAMTGGVATAIAMLRENYPDLYEEYKDNPNELAYIASTLVESATTPELTGLEELAAPRSAEFLRNIFLDPTSGMIKEQRQSDTAEFGEDYGLQQSIDTQQNIRDRVRAGDDSLFAEGSVVEMLKGTPGYAFPRKSEAYDISGSMVSPEVEDFVAPQVGEEAVSDMGVRTSSGFGDSPLGAPEIGSLPDLSGVDRQNLLAYLRGEGSGRPDIIDDLDRRAQEYMQADQFTPPEEIYDLGPKGRIKYETEDPAERDRLFTETAQREFLERQAADAAAEQRVLDEEARVEGILQAARESDETRIDDMGGIAPKQNLLEQGIEYAAEKLDDFKKSRQAARGEEIAQSYETEGDAFDAYLAEQEAADVAEKAKQAEQEALKDIAEIDAATTSKATSGDFGSTDSRIAKMLSDRQKQAESDKWMALAFAGMELMKPTATIGEGLGKAGQAGLGYLQQSKKGLQDFETDMMKLQTTLDAARARGQKSGALTLNQYLARGEDLITAGQKMIENAGDNADAAERGQALIDRGMALINTVTGGGNTGSSGSKTVDIS